MRSATAPFSPAYPPAAGALRRISAARPCSWLRAPPIIATAPFWWSTAAGWRGDVNLSSERERAGDQHRLANQHAGKRRAPDRQEGEKTAGDRGETHRQRHARQGPRRDEHDA